MSRLKEKITPSLRAALDKIGDNVESIPDVDSPHYLPRWDFSQSTDKINITLYVKVPDPTLSYCEQSESGGYLLFACYGWHKRIVSLKVADLHEDVIEGSGLLTMTPNKLEISLRKESAGDITWPKLHGEVKPKVTHEGVMNPEPPRSATIDEPIVEEPEEETDTALDGGELLEHNRTGSIFGASETAADKQSAKMNKKGDPVKFCNPKESAAAKQAHYKEKMSQGEKVAYPEYDSEEEAVVIRKELARLPEGMRKRMKVVLKAEGDSDSSLDGVEGIDWVESANAAELMKNSSYVSDKMGTLKM